MLHEVYVLLDDGDRHVLRQFQLNPTQYAALLLLDEHNGARLSDISRQLLIDKSSTTRLVDRLSTLGFVTRVADPSDRRVQRIMMATLGRAHLAMVRAAHCESIARRWAVLDSADHALLTQLLLKLRRALARLNHGEKGGDEIDPTE